MLEFYLLGAAAAFCMLMFLFLKPRPWEEDNGVPADRRTVFGVVISCILICLFISLFSWGTVAFLLAKRISEIRDGI